MPEGRIDKGSPQARLTIALIDAWLQEEDAELEALLDRVGSDFGVVFWNLIVVLAGTIQAIASYANQTFEEVLPGVLAQMEARTEWDEAAEVARRALTAWSTGDDELVARLGFDPEIEKVGPREVLKHFLGMLVSIGRSWAKQAGFPFSGVREGWAQGLGTTDEPQ